MLHPNEWDINKISRIIWKKKNSTKRELLSFPKSRDRTEKKKKQAVLYHILPQINAGFNNNTQTL